MNAKLAAGLLLTGALLWSAPVFAYTSPGSPTGYVNDFAHVLSNETKNSLESELKLFEASTSNEIAVAIVPNMNGDYVENYAVKLFEDWKIGKKEKDNGVLLVLAIEERKMRIEVGYGLEGALPDSVAGRILDNEMTPRLKAQDYDGAVTAGVHAIEAATQGEYTSSNTLPAISSWISWIFQDGWFVIVFVLIILQWIGAVLGRSKSWWAGGILGVLGGLGIGWFLALSFTLLLPIALLLGLFGLLFDFIVSRTYHGAKMSGTLPPWWAGGGGIGGGSSSGGFGGFGGGGSGGGGASGGW